MLKDRRYIYWNSIPQNTILQMQLDYDSKITLQTWLTAKFYKTINKEKKGQ